MDDIDILLHLQVAREFLSRSSPQSSAAEKVLFGEVSGLIDDIDTLTVLESGTAIKDALQDIKDLL